MNRRDFLIQASRYASAGLAVAAVPTVNAARDIGAVTQRLSVAGSGRATGYAETNKIVTVADKTHVAWLDSPAEGFRVRVRTLDRKTGKWSPTYTVGQAYDNHGGPALTVDSKGFLHVVYFPHHRAFRYRKSKRANDASQWGAEVQFGQRCTYPTLVCGHDDTLHLTCRRSFAKQPWQVELWTKTPDGDWRRANVIARARFTGYSHFQESLAWGPDHRVLHLACRFHEKSDGGAYGRLQTVAYMFSDDLGKTWRRRDGAKVKLPVTAESVDVLAKGGVDAGRILRCGALAVGRDGRPRVVYSVRENDNAQTWIATPGEKGAWERTKLNRFLPARWRGWSLAMPGGLTFTTQGRLVAVATLQKTPKGQSFWGHGSSEVAMFRSTDSGKTFSFQLLSEASANEAHWLPNIERSTGHHHPPRTPGVIYTAGPPGAGNKDLMSNKVYWRG